MESKQHASGDFKAELIKYKPLKFPSPQWDHISEEAKDFCAALMQKAPKDRLSAVAVYMWGFSEQLTIPPHLAKHASAAALDVGKKAPCHSSVHLRCISLC